MQLNLTRHLCQMETVLRSAPAGKIGVAVSGGGDSLALLLLLDQWAHENRRTLMAVTVDHGLRPESSSEAQAVARLCAARGIAHEILHWRDWDGTGNLQNAARLARYRLITDWAAQNSVTTVATGHTRDDQAETFLMRLARGSGVDGLAAMHPIRRRNGLLWMRPLLTTGRQELRDYLAAQGISWADDPSNDDSRYDRIKIRKAMRMLADLGLTIDTLCDTATRMQQARTALELATLDFAQAIASPRPSGSVRVRLLPFLQATPELQGRLLAHCLGWVGTSRYRPRLRSLLQVIKGLNTQRNQTLSGCNITRISLKTFEISREASAMRSTTDTTGLFDGRWQMGTPADQPCQIRPLGKDGILMRPDWRQSAESRNTILSTPSVWYNNELKFVPLLDKDQTCTCQLASGVDQFFSSILTH